MTMHRALGLFALGMLAAVGCNGSPTPPPPAAASSNSQSDPPPAPPTPAPAATVTAPKGAAPLPDLSDDAPKDQPFAVYAQERPGEEPPGLDALNKAFASCIEEAKKSYPGAKDRYLKGLPTGHAFYVVTHLKDAQNRAEQVFIAVSSIKEGKVSGRVANEILSLEGYKMGDAYSFPESEVIDWLISRPDGTEEGNLIGKLMDNLQRQAHEQPPQ